MNRSDRLLELLPVLLVGVSLSTCKKEDDEAKVRERHTDECARYNLRGQECYGEEVDPAYEAEVRDYCAEEAMSGELPCVEAMADYYACFNALSCPEIFDAEEDPCPEQAAEVDQLCEGCSSETVDTEGGDDCGQSDPSGGDPSTSGPDPGEDSGGGETSGGETGTG